MEKNVKLGVLKHLMNTMDKGLAGKLKGGSAIVSVEAKPDPDDEVQHGIADALQSLTAANRAQLDDCDQDDWSDEQPEQSDDDSDLAKLKKLASSKGM